MMSSAKSFRVRACISTGVVCAAAGGLIAGTSGSIWMAMVAMGSAVGCAYAISRWIARSLEALITAADGAAHTGCIAEEFPADGAFQEVNRLANSLNRAARSIHHSQADLDCANLQFVETLAQVLDARDPYTAGHSLRVGAYSHAIARAMNVPAPEAQDIRMAAQLHDIGKIGIPDAILQKPGPLTAEEFGLIKLHPQIGRRILEKMEKFREYLPVIELHHENYDGTGYPHRLSGQQIPLGVRIVHVADAFDSMVTHRHYRKALSLRKATSELRENSGTQFDPEVVRVMLALIEAGKLEDMWLPAEERLIATYPDYSFAPVEAFVR